MGDVLSVAKNQIKKWKDDKLESKQQQDLEEQKI